MKKVLTTFFIMVIILSYTNSIYALINNYISLDSDGYEVSGENDNILLIDEDEDEKNISIIIQENKYGIFEISDEQLNYIKKEIKNEYNGNVTEIDDNSKTAIGKDNKYYKCATITYRLDELEMFIKQYIIPTDHYLHIITITTPNKDYFTSKKVIDFLNSITIQDTITNNNSNDNMENTNTTLFEDSISSGIDGAIKAAIFGGFVILIGLIVGAIGKNKSKREQKEENNKYMNKSNSNDIDNNVALNNVDQVKIQLNYQSGAWKDFLENQIGSSGKGKTLKELRKADKTNNKK